MKSSDDHCLQLLRSVILNSLESFSCYSYVHTANMSIIQTKIEAIQQLLQSWLSSYEVVGGNMFGYGPHYQRRFLSKSRVEVKVTQSVLFIYVLPCQLKFCVMYACTLHIDLEVLSFCKVF